MKHEDKQQRLNECIRYIRTNILNGTWKPGERLPDRPWFQKRFGSANFVQEAFRSLLDDEYLITPGSHRFGTIVNPHPPFLHRYAALLGGSRDHMNFHTRGAYEALKLEQKAGRDIRIFFDVEREFDDPEHMKLQADILRHCYAGVYREMVPEWYHRSNYLTRQTEVPVTGAMVEKEMRPNLAAVSEWSCSEDIVFAYFASRGCKTAAAISFHGYYDPFFEEQTAAFAQKYGITVPPGYHIQAKIPGYDFALSHLKTLFYDKKRNLPDGLFIQNDNALPFVMKFMTEFSKLNPEVRKMVLVAIGNYPYLPKYSIPLHYVAVDHCAMIKDFLQFIDDFRAGRPGPGFIKPVMREVDV